MKRQLLIISCLFTGILYKTAIGQPTGQVNYQSIIDSESQYIKKLQLQDGAFVNAYDIGVPGYEISPYYNNISAMSLLEKKPGIENIQIVKNWMAWYMGHLNKKDGTIDDWNAADKIGNPMEKDSNEYDSIDSYAATFMSLAKKLCDVSPSDINWLKNYTPQLNLIAQALNSVIDKTTGLTFATYTDNSEYLIDNCEVNYGMQAMAWLSANQIISGNWRQYFNSNTAGFKYFRDVQDNFYFSEKDNHIIDWSIFYPDATCQLFPVLYGIIQPNSIKAKQIWSKFNNQYLNWSTGYLYGDAPWTVICYVAFIMKDYNKVDAYLSYVQAYTDKGNQPGGWYNMEASFVLRSAIQMQAMRNMHKRK